MRPEMVRDDIELKGLARTILRAAESASSHIASNSRVSSFQRLARNGSVAIRIVETLSSVCPLLDKQCAFVNRARCPVIP